MSNKEHVFLCGGTGEECGLGFMHLKESISLLRKGECRQLHMVYETMDDGGKALGYMRQLSENAFPFPSRDPHIEFGCVEIADKVRLFLTDKKISGDVRFRDVLPPEYRDRALFKNQTLDNLLSHGFYGDMKLAVLFDDLGMEAAKGSTVDQKMGFEAVVDEVVNSNRNYEVRAVFIGSGMGGEGRQNLARHSALLREQCIEAVEKRLNLGEGKAEQYVSDVLKIAVIMVGGVHRFPKLDGLNQDVAGLVAGTLQNFPQEAIESLDAFYLLENDNMPVQATEASYGNDQHKHAHAIQLVAYEAMEDFFERTAEELKALRRNDDRKLLRIIIPHYALPGNGKANWKNLMLPEEHRIALAGRLRIDAMLFLWLRPQLMPPRTENVFESDFLCKMYGANKSSALRKKVTYSELEEAVIGPFKALLEREKLFLRWLRDISLTGRDWERMQDPDDSTLADLFPVREIELLLCEDPRADINKLGGMRNYNLDCMTNCGEGNPYSSGLTPDWLRTRLTYRKNSIPVPFPEIMEQLYDLCADTNIRI
ncbi:MAG: hypothetical protein Q4D81_01430 [Eubacteriales bacterium]|nr:hypothetical protein [Eubacteriales bacterium]